MTVHRFAVYRDHFPFGSPVWLDELTASDQAAATKVAKLRWPGVPLLVTRLPQQRSASSAAPPDAGPARVGRRGVLDAPAVSWRLLPDPLVDGAA